MRIKLRPMTLDDQDFVVQSWLEYYKAYSQFGKAIPGKVFFREHRKLIKRMLELAPCHVACDINDPTFLVGFVCMENLEDHKLDILHFVFVRQQLRKSGIGRALLEHCRKHDEVEFSHQGDIRALWSLWQNHKTKLFNPYHFFGIR